MQIHKKTWRQKGFTMVEIVVVIVVFGIGIMTLGSLLASLQIAQRNDFYLETATTTARMQMEKIRNSQYLTITDGTSFTSELPSTLPEGSTGIIHVASSPPNSPLSKKVDVTVTYPVGLTPKEVTITGYVDQPEDL